MQTPHAQRFAVGDKVFFRHAEQSWITGHIKQVQANPAYKPAYADMPEHLKKREHSSLWYQIMASDTLMQATGETVAFVEDWRVEVYDESIEARPVDDLLSLVHLHDAAILRTLAVRYYQDIIYTNIGVIVVAINPFNSSIPRYLESRMQQYLSERGQPISDKLLPHSWAQAHNTYHDLSTSQDNQSILISGESGAGKTEAAKIVLKYLAHVSVASGTAEEQQRAQRIATTITACSPILEAFGNAKTVRNDNSSRFGKLLNLKFDKRTMLFSGAHATNYLLEKSRVMTCSKNERIYHSFYLASVSRDAKTVLKLDQAATSYKSLFSGGILDNKEFSTAEHYDEVVAALRCIGIADLPLQSVWLTVSAILNMSNVTFTAVGDQEGSTVDPATAKFLQATCDLWGVSFDAMERELVSTELVVMGTATRKLLPMHRALDVRDALCKAVYSGLFDWLVRQCNEACDVKDASLQTIYIALLDIFGFESFEHNSFEQLCINFANETLQQHYNYFVFNKDMQLCRQEGIDTLNIECPDLRPTLQLIQNVLSALDDQCALNGSELVFVEELVKSHHKVNPAFLKDLTKKRTFGIVHFAGSVTYDVEGWIEKNRDTLKPVFREQLFANANVTVNALSSTVLVPVDHVGHASPQPSAAGGGSKKKNAGPLTVSVSFRAQMSQLLAVIEATNPHWIRCVKPHVEKKPRMFSSSYTLRQLEFSGILGTVKIRKAGYPVRYPHKTFCVQFAAIARLEALQEASPGAIKKHCSVILAACGMDRPMQSNGSSSSSNGPVLWAQIGTTLVFLKSDGFYELERHRRNATVQHAMTLQRVGRALCRRVKVLHIKVAKQLQRIGRAFLSNQMLFKAYSLRHAAALAEVRRRREEAEKQRREEARRKAIEDEKKRRELEASMASWNLALVKQRDDLEEECMKARALIVDEEEACRNAPVATGSTSTTSSSIGMMWQVIKQRARYEAFQRFLRDKLAPLEAEYHRLATIIRREEDDFYFLMTSREWPVRRALWLREMLARTRREEIRVRAELEAQWDEQVLYLQRVHEGAMEQEKYRLKRRLRHEAARSSEMVKQANQPRLSAIVEDQLQRGDGVAWNEKLNDAFTRWHHQRKDIHQSIESVEPRQQARIQASPQAASSPPQSSPPVQRRPQAAEAAVVQQTTSASPLRVRIGLTVRVKGTHVVGLITHISQREFGHRSSIVCLRVLNARTPQQKWVAEDELELCEEEDVPMSPLRVSSRGRYSDVYN